MAGFKKGQSGNPKGRPKGSYTKQLTALREACDQVLPLVIEKALAGDTDMMKLIIDRAIPRAKPASPAEPFTLPEGDLLGQVQAVLQQVADGSISPTAATEIVSLISTAAKVEEIDHLRSELSILKHTLERRNQ